MLSPYRSSQNQMDSTELKGFQKSKQSIQPPQTGFQRNPRLNPSDLL